MRLLDTTRGRSVLHIGWGGLRKEHLKKEPFCMACGYGLEGSFKGLDVHHIFPRHLFPDLALEHSNLITLCRKYDCHLRVGHFGNYTNFYNPGIRVQLLLSHVAEIIRKAEAEFMSKPFEFHPITQQEK